MSLSLLYIRVSSKEQEKEGYSLDAQEKLGEEYALRNNLTIVKRWRVSESAWGEDRISFSEMLDYAKKHDDVKHIIFDVTDRMTRNDMDKLRIYTLIKLHDKTIHFSRSNKTINKNSGSEDEFMLDIEVAVAKKMSNDISRKTQMGMLEKAEQGLYPSSAPLGYINNTITRLLEVDKERAPHIKKAFELIASGNYSLLMVSDKLHKEGFRTAKDNKVNKSSIFHFINNHIYYGAFKWKSKIYQGSHEPIISKELFDRAQETISGPARPSISKNGFPFNNLITCGICNCKVLGEIKKHKYIYYHCTFSKGRHKDKHYINQDRLANIFGPAIKDVTLPKELTVWIKEALRERSKNTLKLQENRLQSLETQYERVNTRLSKLYDMKLDGEITQDMFGAKENEYKAQLIEIKSQIDSAKNVTPNFYEDGCKTLELSNRLYPLYVKSNHQEKAKIASLVASNYTLNDVTLSPTYRKPFSFFTKRASRPMWLGALVYVITVSP
ncbi:recombinase family protein [bacterium]|nr:MAG: recombinase family protein [bacterium]